LTRDSDINRAAERRFGGLVAMEASSLDVPPRHLQAVIGSERLRHKTSCSRAELATSNADRGSIIIAGGKSSASNSIALRGWAWMGHSRNTESAHFGGIRERQGRGRCNNQGCRGQHLTAEREPRERSPTSIANAREAREMSASRSERRRAKQLALRQQRRLELALAALAYKSKLAAADEPVAGMQPDREHDAARHHRQDERRESHPSLSRTNMAFVMESSDRVRGADRQKDRGRARR